MAALEPEAEQILQDGEQKVAALERALLDWQPVDPILKMMLELQVAFAHMALRQQRQIASLAKEVENLSKRLPPQS